MRLFAAVRPPADVIDHLEGALVSVRGPAVHGRGGTGGLRWTPPENRHVTLAFYGEVPGGYLHDLASALDAVAASTAPFEAALAGAGVFDGRTLWVGCTGAGWPTLMAAAGQAGADVVGRAADGRHRPHLTVARARGAGGRHDARGRSARTGRADVVGPGSDPAHLAHALALYRGPAWTVAEVLLVSSALGAGPGGGPRYDVVHSSPLGAVAG